MIKKLLLILVLSISLLYLLGCTKQVTPPTPPTKPETITEPKAVTTEDKAADIEGSISDAGVLNDDLALGELENIDQELEDVTW